MSAREPMFSVRTVRRLISAGTLTAYRIGPRLIWLDADEVQRVMLANPVLTP